MMMGGIRMTESEDIILGTRFLLIAGGVLTAPIWLIGYVSCYSMKSPWTWQLHEMEQQNQPVSWNAWMLALVSLLFLTPFLPWTQHEQWLRWRAEKLLLAGSFGEVSKLTHEHSEKDLPPHWDPPPRIGYGETKPELISATIAIHASNPADWFWRLYLDKLARKRDHFRFEVVLSTLNEAELAGFIELFETLRVSSWHAALIDVWIEKSLMEEPTNQERQELLIKIQELCKAKIAESKKT